LKDFFNIMGNNRLPLILSVVVSYLFGSISFAIISTKLFQKTDIREHGSGNAGATNVLRSAGVKPAIMTFSGDLLKAIASVIASRVLFSTLGNLNQEYLSVIPAFIAGLFCIVGHMFPLFFSFRGGKGIMTTAGMILMLDYRIFVILIVIYAIFFAITKTISKCSILIAVLIPIVTFLVKYFLDYSKIPNYPLSLCFFSTSVSLIVGLLIIVGHRDNIKRILKGEEKKFSVKSK